MPNSSISFAQLSPANRILVLLGTVKDPVSQQLALLLSGVEWEQLTISEQAEIEEIFNSPRVQRSDSTEYGPQFKLNPKVKKELTNINWPTVQRELKGLMVKSLMK